MSATARLTRWWEDPATNGRQGSQGDLVSPAGRSSLIRCPACGRAWVVYNGNYFCDDWSYPVQPGGCDWALAHPARSKRDREFCDLVGIDYE